MKTKNQTFLQGKGISLELRIRILDTNVLINDPYSLIVYLRKGDVILPTIVLEELDHLKKKLSGAQDAIRIIEKLISPSKGEKLLNGGVSVTWKGEVLKGKLSFRIAKPVQKLDELGFNQENPDNKIIGIAYGLMEEGRNVTLISEDFNVRAKARLLNIDTKGMDYLDVSKDVLEYTGQRTIFVEDMNLFMEDGKYKIEPLSSQELLEKYSPRVNEYFLIPGNQNIFYRFDGKNFVHRVRRKGILGIQPRNLEQAVVTDALLNDDIKLITISGRAGTGKTFLALLIALFKKNKGYYEDILVSRRELGVEDNHGFLPGGEEEKILPYMMPFVDNYKVIQKAKEGNKKAFQKMSGENGIPFHMISLIYLRGRSLPYSFIIIDEAQNLSPHQVKTIITRAGEGTKIIFLGDLSQVDEKKYLRRDMNGFAFLIDKMRKMNPKIYAHFTLEKVVRSKLAELGTRL